MRTYALEDRGSTPLYEYLYRCIREDILAGALAAGERLPSKRALAAHLKISVVTVEGAYGQLLAEGYLRSEPKRGFFVQAVQEEHRPAASPLPPAEPLQAKPSLPYDFSTSGVDTGLFPFSTWAKLMREVLSARADSLLASSHPQGVPELRRAIAEHLYRFRGIRAAPEQIVVGAGSETLLAFLVQLLGRDGGYGVEDPGYAKPHRILTSCGAVVRPIPLDGQGLRVDVVRERAVRVVHVTPSHHYPLGIIMPVARRQALLRWAAEQPGRYILEDDYDSEFRFSGRPIPALQSLDGGERVIYLNTFAKSLAPSLRISYMVLPEHLLKLYRKKLGFYACTVSNFEQYTLEAFLREGYFEKHINRMRNYYRGKRDTVIRAIRSGALKKRIRVLEEDAGLHFLIRIDTELSDEEVKERLAGQGIRMKCLTDYSYCHNPFYTHMFVVNYSGVEEERLPEAMERLQKCI